MEQLEKLKEVHKLQKDLLNLNINENNNDMPIDDDENIYEY